MRGKWFQYPEPPGLGFIVAHSPALHDGVQCCACRSLLAGEMSARFIYYYNIYREESPYGVVILLQERSVVWTSLWCRHAITGEERSVDFLSVAVRELVKARHVLCACAVLGYFTSQPPTQQQHCTGYFSRPTVQAINRHYNTTLLDCLQVQILYLVWKYRFLKL